MRSELKLALWVFWSAGSIAAQAITVAGLQAQLAKGEKPTVIDIRSPERFAQGHIPGAINVPASLWPHKRLPPLGRVVVCGEGLGRNDAAAAAALGAKPGITAEILEGGFAAWESAHAPDTRKQGLSAEALNYVSYAELKAASANDVVLVDLRRPAAPVHAVSSAPSATTNQPLTDLAQEFPGARRVQLGRVGTIANANPGGGSGTPPLLVLIDSGDGSAQAIARRLKASGVRRYAILAGGELTLARHGQPGLQRTGSHTTLPVSGPASGGRTP